MGRAPKSSSPEICRGYLLHVTVAQRRSKTPGKVLDREGGKKPPPIPKVRRSSSPPTLTVPCMIEEEWTSVVGLRARELKFPQDEDLPSGQSADMHEAIQRSRLPSGTAKPSPADFAYKRSILRLAKLQSLLIESAHGRYDDGKSR
jgi:hypothetical protein